MSSTETTTGSLFVVSAPSGAGKTSLLKALIEAIPSLQVSISHTTRPIRPGEIDGKHYHFISEEKFQAMVQEKAFIEHAEVFGHHYGTARRGVEATLSQGIDTLLEIDWQGAAQVRNLFPQAISIFILPPSLQALKDRLEGRKQDTPDVIKRRSIKAKTEIAQYHYFDYLVTNDEFATALSSLKAIIQANRLTQARQATKYAKLLAELLE